MNNRVDATKSFRFTDGSSAGTIYSYDAKTSTVTGGNIGDPIRYLPSRVDTNLQTGSWKVIEDPCEFPRAGVNAKFERNSKVYIVGKSTTGTNMWVVETSSEQLLRVSSQRLSQLAGDDEQAFEMCKDLGVNFETAVRMIKKGYGKL